MTSQDLIGQLREKQREYQIEPFVMDFLEFWDYLHTQAPHHTIETTLDFLQSIWKSHTLPFYEKYKEKMTFNQYEGWVKSFGSFAIGWGTRGHITFPLELFTYEICNWNESLLEELIQKICTKVIEAKKDVLFEKIIPTIINFVVPLTDADILVIKAMKTGTKRFNYDYLLPKRQIAPHSDISSKTIHRRLKVIQLLQLTNDFFTLDMGKLGFETYLMIHHNQFPKEMKKYLLFTSELSVGSFSLLQIPLIKKDDFYNLNKKLNPVLTRKMENFVRSWNLSQIQIGKERWKGNVPTINPRNRIISQNPDNELDLLPSMDSFRKLTEIDIRILDFMTSTGTFNSITQFSKAIGLSRNELSKRLSEYKKAKIVTNYFALYNVGLTPFWIYISDKTNDFNLYSQLSQLPLTHLFLTKEEAPFVCFGLIKMPIRWLNEFSRNIDLIKQELKLTIHFKSTSSVDFVRNGNLLLSEAY